MKNCLLLMAMAGVVFTGCEMHPPRKKAEPHATAAKSTPAPAESRRPAPAFFPGEDR